MSETYRTNLEPIGDRFDFTGLSSYPPSGLRIVEARDYFHATRTTAAGTTNFFIVKKNGTFRLHSQKSELGQVGVGSCNDANLVLERDSIGPLLNLLGYGKGKAR